MSSSTDLVTIVIGFGLSATFIVFVCSKIICERLKGRVGSRTIYEIDSRRTDIEQPEYHVNDPVPALVAAIPIFKFNQEAFTSIEEDTQCVICLADYKEQELLRIIPKCGHSFHLACIDLWLKKQSTCPVCRLPLQNACDTKHARPVTFAISQSLEESNTSERNTGNEREHVEANASN
ncbi:hypothetical protein RIF29_15709 [Crotalaria pallida]|uniref:RING-type domain-containing protein n=1 Tax=Crotalaria pallida TaxID=3830 RepID=A0AAN9IBE5_CROPI